MRIKKEYLETMYGKMLSETELSIMGFSGKMRFEIYDGFAYCPDHDGDEYCLIYPKIEFVEKSGELRDEIRRYIGLEESDEITIFEILQTFNEMIRNGVRIEYDEETNGYKEKCMWKGN